MSTAEKTVHSDAMRVLEQVCGDKGIKLINKEISKEYFVYNGYARELIICPSANAEHLSILTKFILS